MSRSATWRTVAAVISLAALLIGWAAGMIPLQVLIGCHLMSSIAFVLYRHDKRAAQSGKRRTRERTLHLVDVLGGWPGGLLAQDHQRHKTRKTAFQLAFWGTVVVNCIALLWLLRVG